MLFTQKWGGRLLTRACAEHVFSYGMNQKTIGAPQKRNKKNNKKTWQHQPLLKARASSQVLKQNWQDGANKERPLTAAELEKVAEYERIVKLAEDVKAGRHPTVKIPNYLVSMTGAPRESCLCMKLWKSFILILPSSQLSQNQPLPNASAG